MVFDSVFLPEVFDLRNSTYLCPVRSQPGGGCWASASNTTVESYWRKSGIEVKPLSDVNLQLFHGFEENRNTYGNHLMATAYYTRGSGPMYKNPETDTIPFIRPEIPFLNIGARYLPNDPDLIKKTIFTCGPVYSMLHFRRENTDTISNIHYTDKKGINHALSIVGWNDTLLTRQGRGVWIAQNSLGAAYGDSGFVYIPFQDKNILDHNAVWTGWEPYNPKQCIYYYDTLGSTKSYGFNNSVCYGMIRFTAGEKGRVERVGTFVQHSDTYIHTEVYQNFDEKSKNLSECLSISNEKFCRFAGYYTLELTNPVDLEKGKDFYVLVRYFTPNDTMPMPVEQYLEDYADPDISENCCWINPDFEQWPDAWYKVGLNSEFDFLVFDLCIRVYYLNH